MEMQYVKSSLSSEFSKLFGGWKTSVNNIINFKNSSQTWILKMCNPDMYIKIPSCVYIQFYDDDFWQKLKSKFY